MRLAGSRWLSAVAGGAVAGMIAGLIGGIALRFGPGAEPVDSLLVTIPLIGMILGILGACGVGAGLAVAEVVVRSMRGPALVLGGACGGGAVGLMLHETGRLTLQILFGRDLSPVMGGFEGLVLGGAIGEKCIEHLEGRLRPHVSQTFPLEDLPQALQLFQARQVTGKIVIRLR